jgi:ferredoxin
MIKATLKPMEEILARISGYKQVLIVGCGGCVSVCLAGGQPEVELLNEELEKQVKAKGLDHDISGCTVERQCNAQFLVGLDQIHKEYDCLLSMACGAGNQLLAERYPMTPIFPAVNTMFIGIDKGPGWYEEKCRACGNCVLGFSGGICPVTRCAKGLYNGPCGGTDNGKCEVDKNEPCAWYDIYHRLKQQGRLSDILEIKPPVQWKNTVQQTLVQPGFTDPAA